MQIGRLSEVEIKRYRIKNERSNTELHILRLEKFKLGPKMDWILSLIRLDQVIIIFVFSLLLQCMKNYMEATDGSWYSRWLFLTWLIEPMVAAVVVFTLETVPADSFNKLSSILYITDVIHLLYIISEFFTVSSFYEFSEIIVTQMNKNKRFK